MELVLDSVLLGGVDVDDSVGGVVLDADGDAVPLAVDVGFGGCVGCGCFVDVADGLLDDAELDDVGLEE
jgi:hypothetical protein